MKNGIKTEMTLAKRLRTGNLAMIAIAQALLYYTVVTPMLGAAGLATALGPFEFWLLVVSVLCIAAGGYLVNDLQDTQEDGVNKAGNPPGRSVRIAYVVTTLAGLAIGFYLSWFRHVPLVLQVHLLASFLLLAYSGFLRQWKFLGNLVVAALVAMALLIVPMSDQLARADPGIRNIAFGYAFFAFMLSWIREIIKDLEDLEGDRRFGKKTIAVLAGPAAARLVALMLTGAVVLSLAWLQYSERQWEALLPFLYIVALVQVPLMVLAAGLVRSHSSIGYGRLSTLAKGIMAAGIMSMYVFYLLY